MYLKNSQTDFNETLHGDRTFEGRHAKVMLQLKFKKYASNGQWAVRLSWLENAYSRPLYFGRQY